MRVQNLLSFLPYAKLFIIILTLEIGVMFFGAIFPLSPSQISEFAKLNQEIVKIASLPPLDFFFNILKNNFMIWASDVIPFLGWVTFVSASFNTGQYIQAVAVINGYPSYYSFGLLLLLFFSPHTLVELSSYALIVTASLILLHRIIKKDLKSIVSLYPHTFVNSLLLLVFGAFLETLVSVFPLIAGLFWPLVLFLLFARRKNNA